MNLILAVRLAISGSNQLPNAIIKITQETKVAAPIVKEDFLPKYSPK